MGGQSDAANMTLANWADVGKNAVRLMKKIFKVALLTIEIFMVFWLEYHDNVVVGVPSDTEYIIPTLHQLD